VEGSTLSDALPASDRDLLVLIADSDIEAGKRTAAAVASWGFQPILVHDGVEAMLMIQRMGPRAVVLDAALPKMFGFQICEVVKRNESLRDTHVVLIGAIHHRERYPRVSEELYGADVYIERPDLLEGLATVLRRLGLALKIPGESETAVPSTLRTPNPIASSTFGDISAPQATPAPAPMPEAPTPAPEAFAPRVDATPSANSLDDERAKAERLARIIVSDIVLYNPEKFDEAVKAGDVVAMLDPALEEGRELFRQRIDERVRNERDYLEAELRRVASEQGAR
jgi:CheY-like chemotaxis protein